MFTGIVEKLADVVHADRKDDRLEIDVATGFADLELGESVAVNGVCLTVISFDGSGQARFFVSAETLDRSNLGALVAGTRVNLERAVRADTRLSGHIVQGHVDGKGVLRAVTSDNDAYLIAVAIRSELGRYCVEKGSICLNGISLTINSLQQAADDEVIVGITIIPHTMEHTNLSVLAPGDAINVEVDVMAKYVERLCQPYQTQ